MGRSRTYSSVPVRCARTRLVRRIRSGPSTRAGGTVAPQGFGERFDVLMKRHHLLVGASGDAVGAVALVERRAFGVPAAAIGEVGRPQVLGTERFRSELIQRALHLRAKFFVGVGGAQLAL